MLLDDDPLMLKLVSRQLENLGFAAPTAHTNGHRALAAIAEAGGTVNLILMDLNMPDMDGIEFVRLLVEQQYAGSLILVSGEDERMLAAAATLVRARGINLLGQLRKPISNKALAALLETWAPPRLQLPAATKTIYSVNELAAAIANNQLINHYQPKVALDDGHVVGVEALVRWRHPFDGMVFPDQFIGLAESNGLIDELTRVVLSQALAQTRTWRDAGLALRVAVNLSMDNLTEVEFANFVSEQASLAGVVATDIVLEVTESRLMSDVRTPLDVLTRLRLKRFCLSIDDFGTGNSSLVQLRDIPFDQLKIDRSFVHGACTDETRRAIFNGSLHLARQLGMEVVAEGVEDRADWDFLRLSGCDLAQGYFIARPMHAAELPAWMVGWEERRADLTSRPSAGRLAIALH